MNSIPYLKRRTLEVGCSPLKQAYQGEYRLVKQAIDGSVVQDTGWFPNLITDGGLNRMGSGTWVGACDIGTGTSTPSFSDTALTNFSARSTAVGSSIGNTGSPLYIGEMTYNAVFAFGTLNGNYTEVGMAYLVSGSTYNLFSKALILDGSSSPTSITILPTEQLTVYYKIRLVPNLSDVTGTLTIGSTTYDTIIRPASVGNWRPSGGAIQFAPSTSFKKAGNIWYGGSAALGAITGTPSGLSTDIYWSASNTYVNNSLENTGYIELNQAEPNPAGGTFKVMQVWHLPNAVANGVQIDFAPVVPKDNTRQIIINGKVAWGRL